MPIGQLILQEISPRPKSDALLKGSYLGPVYPEAPKFKRLRDELGSIGISISKVDLPGVCPKCGISE
jgi:hypothetical protein